MFFNNLFKSLQMGFRMIKMAITKPFRSLWFKLKRSTNVGRQMAKAIPGVTKGLTKIKVKPEKRADYIDAGPVYIAKSFFFVVILVIVVLFLLWNYLLWPFLRSRFFTGYFYEQASVVEDYNGRVELYYDSSKDLVHYQGRMEEGKLTGEGKEYYTNGNVRYEGGFVNGLYEGQGVLFNEENKRIYEGSFAAGLYEGKGKLYSNGELYLEGTFVAGEPQGNVKLYEDNKLLYDGAMANGKYEGRGVIYHSDGETVSQEGTFAGGKLEGSGATYYESGSTCYKGDFVGGEYSGAGSLYYPGGKLQYNGNFNLGQYDGEGVLFYENGQIAYKGGFASGKYSGSGELYDENGKLVYRGEFADGLYSGAGTLMTGDNAWVEGSFELGGVTGSARVYRDGRLYYEGGFIDGRMEGDGSLYNSAGQVILTANFQGGAPDGSALVGKTADDVRTAFGGALQNENLLDNGFQIVNQEYGMAVFCNYLTDTDDPVVHRVYLYDPAVLSQWENMDSFPQPEDAASVREGRRRIDLIEGVEGMDGSNKYCRTIRAKDYILLLWSDSEGGPLILVEYMSYTTLPSAPAAESEGDDVLSGLLGELGLEG